MTDGERKVLEPLQAMRLQLLMFSHTQREPGLGRLMGLGLGCVSGVFLWDVTLEFLWNVSLESFSGMCL